MATSTTLNNSSRVFDEPLNEIYIDYYGDPMSYNNKRDSVNQNDAKDTSPSRPLAGGRKFNGTFLRKSAPVWITGILTSIVFIGIIVTINVLMFNKESKEQSTSLELKQRPITYEKTTFSSVTNTPSKITTSIATTSQPKLSDDWEDLFQDVLASSSSIPPVDIVFTCPVGWSSFCDKGNNCACYKFVSTPMSWLNASSYCIKENSKLASIHTKEENNFLDGLTKGEAILPFIGLKMRSGQFQWDDDTKFDFSNWDMGEPNDKGGIEKCSQMRSTDYINTYSKNNGTYSAGKWNDIKCSEEIEKFFCKKY